MQPAMPSPASATTQCWICGSTQKLTREHFPKKADTRRYMKPGQMFRHTATRRNQRIQSAASKLLYLGAPICESCNTARTQAHDRAWDAMRDYTLDNWPAILAAGELDLQAVYGAAWQARSIDLQLYFVKVLGCAVVHQQIPIAVQPLRDALLTGAAHPHLFLMLSDSKPPAGQQPRAMLGAGDLHTFNDAVSGETAAAFWRYTLQPVSIRMIYALPTYPHRPVSTAWHPSAGNSIMRLGPPAPDVDLPPRTRRPSRT